MASTLSPEVIAKIKAEYPEYSFFFDQADGGFGSDLLELLIKATTLNYTKEKFDLELSQTAYYNQTSDAAKKFDKKTKTQRDSEVQATLADLQTAYGDIYDKPSDLLRVATAATRQGLTGNRLKYFVNASAVKIGAGPQIVKTAAADKLRSSVREYGYPVSDEEITAALTGTPYKSKVYTEDSLINMAKLAAKGNYSHLATQIDAGLSLDDIFKNYRAYASQILELDPNDIDFVKDPKYADAFGDAKSGQLSLSAWQQKLKTEDKYGWKFTNQANQQVSSMVSTLERAFGLVR